MADVEFITAFCIARFDDSIYMHYTNISLHLLEENFDLEYEMHTDRVDFLTQDLNETHPTQIVNVGHSEKIPISVAKNGIMSLIQKLDNLRYNIANKNWINVTQFFLEEIFDFLKKKTPTRIKLGSFFQNTSKSSSGKLWAQIWISDDLFRISLAIGENNALKKYTHTNS